MEAADSRLTAGISAVKNLLVAQEAGQCQAWLEAAFEAIARSGVVPLVLLRAHPQPIKGSLLRLR